MAATSKPLNIKNAEAYRLAQELSGLTGESLTEVVLTSLRDRLQRERTARPDPLWLDRLREISDRCASRPVLDSRSDDELLGYDELGLPH